MSNLTSSRLLSQDIKKDIEDKMKNDYSKVTKVIRTIEDRTQRNEMAKKLMEAYIRKTFELKRAILSLKQLYQNKNLIDVYIPGFDIDARKYIFKNPDP